MNHMQLVESLNFRAHKIGSELKKSEMASEKFRRIAVHWRTSWTGGHIITVHVTLLIIVSCILELFVFNLAHWTSLGNEPLTHTTLSLGSGVTRNHDGSFTINDAGQASIQLSDVNAHISNIAIPVHRVVSYASIDGSTLPVPKPSSVESRADSSLQVHIEVDDAAHAVPMLLPERTISPYIRSTQFIALHLAGQSTSVTIHIMNATGTRFVLNANPQVNAHIPISVNPLRALAYMMIIIAYGSVQLSRRSWKGRSLTARQRRSIWLATGAVSVGISTIVCLISLPWIYFRMTQWQADFEYQSVARALLAGHSWIDHPVASFLSSMTHPYQQDLRYELQQKTHESFLYDFVLYKGKYYSYFGVLPVILFFLPYLAVTGTDLSPWKVMLLLGIILSILSVYLVHLVFERFGKSVPLTVQIVVSLAFMAAIQPTYYLLYLPTTYSIPIASGLMFALGAVIFWMLALRVRSQSISKYWIYLILGGLLCGLIVGCRPQLCVVAVLLPLLIATQHIGSANAEHGPSRLKMTLSGTSVAACAAVIAGFAFLVWNRIRFGSFFDFGASYQLTVTDQREQVSGLTKIPYALWQAFITPAAITDRFPFLRAVTSESKSAGGYQGFFYSEPALGGVIFWFPLALILCLLFIKAIRQRLPKYATVMIGSTAALGLVPIIVDVAASAYTARYLCDFALLIALATVMAIALIYETSVGIYTRYFVKLCMVLAILVLIINTASLFMSGRLYQMADANPILYAAAMNMLAVF